MSANNQRGVRVGYQVPTFEYGDSPHDTFHRVLAQALEAEAADVDCLYVMDHFYPLPLIGPLDGTMFESQTLLAGLAASTTRIGLSPLVASATYRNPMLLAKSVATIDAISGGRARIGLGTGWFEREHRDFGFTLGTLSDRYGKLTETLEILREARSEEPGIVEGRWYRCERPIMNPPLRPDTEVLIGGGGEKRTFALAARYADHLNILADVDAVPRKVAAARERCEEIGRDPATLFTSYTAYLFLGDSQQAAGDSYRRFLADRGPIAAGAAGRHFVGTAESIAGQLHEQVIGKGVDGLIVNLVVDGHVPGRITEVAAALSAIKAA
ncbi:MAG: TIGR03560 family F420-dependent LLM class oxidoreductase [Rhodococcus sp.]|nr:TIGR03560 family F420-dependent LLM class oxidoreductase [Rhodococcus sp. (in: high G+C Gram-positive bacteria)]